MNPDPSARRPRFARHHRTAENAMTAFLHVVFGLITLCALALFTGAVCALFWVAWKALAWAAAILF
jgi:hypothetical protein